MSDYQPELGQAVFGNPTGEYGTPSYGDALVLAYLEDVERVYCNQRQHPWDRVADPEIPGLTFRPYWWGDEEAPEAALPNLEIEGLRLRWYKYPGRGMSCEAEWGSAEWCAWFERASAALHAYERQMDGL